LADLQEELDITKKIENLESTEKVNAFLKKMQPGSKEKEFKVNMSSAMELFNDKQHWD
jgi:hypothetical protein